MEGFLPWGPAGRLHQPPPHLVLDRQSTSGYMIIDIPSSRVLVYINVSDFSNSQWRSSMFTGIKCATQTLQYHVK